MNVFPIFQKKLSDFPVNHQFFRKYSFFGENLKCNMLAAIFFLNLQFFLHHIVN